MVESMSLYDEMKYNLIPRDKSRGWNFHMQHESTIIRDFKDRKPLKDNQKKLDDFDI